MRSVDKRSAWTRRGIVFCIGFMGLVSQALLFRSFLTIFEGNELGVAWFFGSWLLWVAVGALVARSRLLKSDAFCDHFEFLPLVYIPAYLVQSWLTLGSRELAGVASYELFPLAKMVGVALLCNGPVSFCTGLLFSLACKWMSSSGRVPVARVYIWESIGSFAGGLMVTLTLALGASSESVFLCAVLVIAIVLCLYRFLQGSVISGLIPLVVIVGAHLAGLGAVWSRASDLRAWQRLLPREAFGGSFTTPQSKYLHGVYRGQFNVVAWESIADSIPNTEYASEVIAIHLAQHPRARTFLVAGPGSFPISRRLLTLSQAKSVTWLDSDPDYPRQLLKVLPDHLAAGLERLEIPAVDIRQHLAGSPKKYDLMILNLPDVTTLALNRYFTSEFFALAKRRLAESGTIGVRVSGGENFMGDELVNAGASVFSTLSSVFGNVTIKPGDETWLIASDGEHLSALPAVLRGRFRSIENAAGLYPPEGLMSLYLPDRIDYQLRFYREAAANASAELLLNTDRHPKALFHSLLFAARQAGADASATATIRSFATAGAHVLPLAFCLYALLRCVYSRRQTTAQGRHATRHSVVATGRIRNFDSYFLVFSTGMAGMTLSIVLMFMYQSVFGSLFLYVGLISALFMLGLTAGGLVCKHLVAGKPVSPDPGRAVYLLGTGIVLHASLVGLICLLPQELSQPVFAVLFIASGFFGGIYVPAAASLLQAAGVVSRKAGASVEMNDHLGGALGGVLTGLIVLPLFGIGYALGFAAVLLAINLVPLVARRRGESKPAEPERFAAIVRPAGYALFGVCVFMMIVSLWFDHAGRQASGHAFFAAAKSMAADVTLSKRRHSPDDGRAFDYFIVRDAGGATNGYIISSEKLAPDVRGYGGPITMAIRLEPDGSLIDFRIVQSAETPAYLDHLGTWLQGLVGRNLFAKDPLGDIDAVTRATLTSSAVLRTLGTSAGSFAGNVLGRDVEVAHPPVRRLPDRGFLCVAVLVGAALLLRHAPSGSGRRLLLAFAAVGTGLILNAQYSSAHVLSLIGPRTPPVGLDSAFLLTVIVPLLVLLLGNFYCGYLCPFGALQELIGDLRPASLRTDPAKSIGRYGRLIKYVMLALLIALYATTLSPSLASHDLLVTVFSGQRSLLVVFVLTTVLVLSFFFGRFWCRNLCPAGAFLSLLNGVRLLRRFIPGINHEACLFGVTDNSDLDCLCCDRCRRQGPRDRARIESIRETPAGSRRNTILLLAVCALSLLLLQRTVSGWRAETAGAEAARTALGAGGQARPVDMRKLRSLIEQGALTDHEASFYTSPATSHGRNGGFAAERPTPARSVYDTVVAGGSNIQHRTSK